VGCGAIKGNKAGENRLHGFISGHVQNFRDDGMLRTSRYDQSLADYMLGAKKLRA